MKLISFLILNKWEIHFIFLNKDTKEYIVLNKNLFTSWTLEFNKTRKKIMFINLLLIKNH